MDNQTPKGFLLFPTYILLEGPGASLPMKKAFFLPFFFAPKSK